MKNRSTYCFLSIVFYLFFPLSSNAQLTKERIKASMLYYLCDYIEWPENSSQEKTFNIGLLGADKGFSKELDKIARKGKQLHGKILNVQEVSSQDIPDNLHVLYLGKAYHGMASEVLSHCRENAILMVTDEMNNRVLTVINFYFSFKTNSIRFQVNKQNLLLSKLNYKDEILLYGGTLLDVKDLYTSTQKELQEHAHRVEMLKTDVQKKAGELEEKNEKISILNDEIGTGKKVLRWMSDSIVRMRYLIDNWSIEMKEKWAAYDALELDYRWLNSQKILQEKIVKAKEEKLKNLIKEKEERLTQLDKEIHKREAIIQDQSIDLEAKEAKIKAKNQTLLIAQVIVVVITLLVFTLLWLNRTKRRYNKLLKQKVEERTQDLQKSEQNYREIFNGVSDYILIQDENGKIIAVNDPMLKAYGYTEDEIDSLDVEMLSDESKGYTNKKAVEMLNLVKEKGQHTYDWIAKRKNGDTFWVIVALRSTVIGGNKRILSVVRDNDANKKNEIELELHRNNLERLVREKTEDLEAVNKKLISSNEELFTKSEIINTQNIELKAALQHLQETQSQLLQAEKMASLGILTAGVAHEINNPLNYIMGAYVALDNILQHSSDYEEDEKITVLLNAIKTGVDKAASIVQGLNQFSRDNHTYEEDCNIHEIIDNTLTMLNSQLKHRITVQKKYADDEIIVKGNVGKLHQVFVNIISNASHAIGEHGNIFIETEFDNCCTMVKIKDNGEGISEENLQKITDPFFTTKDPGKGTGLGLSITYNVIQEHKGKIQFESELGKGTTVIITLPLNKLQYERQRENFIRG